MRKNRNLNSITCIKDITLGIKIITSLVMREVQIKPKLALCIYTITAKIKKR